MVEGISLQYQGSDIPFMSVVIKESLEAYSAEVEFMSTITFPIFGRITLKSNSAKAKFVIMSRELIGESVTHRMYPENYYNLLLAQFGPISKVCDTVSLLNSLGVPTSEDSNKTAKIAWSLPLYKWKSLVTEIEKFSKSVSGGGTFVYVDIEGNVVVGDYMSRYSEKNSVFVSGSLSRSNVTAEWISDYPGTIAFNIATEEGLGDTKPDTLLEGMGSGSIVGISSKEMAENYRTLVANEFYCKYYLSETIEAELNMPSPFKIGHKVEFQHSKNYYIVQEYIAVYNPSSVPVVNVKLIRPLQDESVK